MDDTSSAGGSTEKKKTLNSIERFQRHAALTGMKVDEKFLKVLEKIEARITEIVSDTPQDVLRDVRSKLFAYLYLMRGEPYGLERLKDFQTRDGLPSPLTKGRASTSIVTTLLPSALNKKAIDTLLATLASVPHQKIAQLSKLMRQHGVTFTSMYNVRGFPDEADIDGITELVEMCTIKDSAGTQFLKNQFSSLCSMFTRQPFPKSPDERKLFFEKVRVFLNTVEEASAEHNINYDSFLSSFTGMLHGRGMPEPLMKIKEFADEIAKLTNGKLDPALLSSFTGMLHGRGMPEPQEYKPFVELCLNRGGIEALKYVVSSSSGMAIPTITETDRLLNIFERINKNNVN